MNIKKYAPLNWFKDEAEEVKNIPIRTAEGQLTPAYPMFHLHNEIDRLFNDAFQGFPNMFSSNWDWPEMKPMMLKPSIDIKDSKEKYTISIETPGVAKEDVDLSIEGNTLTIHGDKKQEKKEDKENYHCIERQYGSFERTLTLPQDANIENIDATFKDGILTVNIKRKAISSPKESKKIDIKAAA